MNKLDMLVKTITIVSIVILLSVFINLEVFNTEIYREQLRDYEINSYGKVVTTLSSGKQVTATRCHDAYIVLDGKRDIVAVKNLLGITHYYVTRSK